MELKSTKELLDLSRSANRQLQEKLTIANQQIAELKSGRNSEKSKHQKVPAFLLADDPMDELLRGFERIDGR